jgi:hypothetical protein
MKHKSIITGLLCLFAATATINYIVDLTSLTGSLLHEVTHTNQCYSSSLNSGLYETSGLYNIKSKDVKLTAFDGKFSITESSQALSISALSSPVLIQQNQVYIMVPIGYYWRSDKAEIMPISDSYLQKKMIEDVDFNVSDFSFSLPENIDATTYYQQIEELDDCTTSALLVKTNNNEPRLQRKLLRNDNLVVLLSFHPKTRLLAWTQDLPVSLEKLRTALLPKSDTAKTALSFKTLERWQQLFARHLNAKEQQTVLRDVERAYNTMLRQGYVLRANRWQTLMGGSLLKLQPLLKTTSTNKVVDKIAVDEIIWESYEVQKQGEELLSALKIIFKSSSSTSINGNTINVSDVLCPTSLEIKKCSFNLHVPSAMISNFTLNGKMYPLSVSVQAATDWLSSL